jgi:hypothetical protein
VIPPDDFADLRRALCRALAEVDDRDAGRVPPQDYQDQVTAVLAVLRPELDELGRLRAELASATTEYAVQAVIDGQPGEVSEYGTERDAVLLRLEQPSPPGYEAVLLTRRTVRTAWTPADPAADGTPAQPPRMRDSADGTTLGA